MWNTRPYHSWGEELALMSISVHFFFVTQLSMKDYRPVSKGSQKIASLTTGHMTLTMP